MAKSRFARELVGNIGQGEIPVNFIDVFVVFVGDEMPALAQEGPGSFAVVGEAPHRAATHDLALGSDVGEGLDGFGLGAENPHVAEAQFFAKILEVSRPQVAWFDPDELPVGEGDGQRKEGEASARSEVQPLPRGSQLEFIGPEEGGERILDVAGKEFGKIFRAHQVLGVAGLARQAVQFLQGGMRGGRNRRLGMFHVEPRLRAKLARV